MKIGIMTMHRVYNYGSFLQAYALKTIIEKLGHEVVFVDYKVERPLIKSKKELINYYKGVLNKYIFKAIDNNPIAIKTEILPPDLRYAAKSHYAYQNSYWKYLGLDGKRRYHTNVDILVIGSDEVFNCLQSNVNVGYSRELFGANAHAKKIITYAASFGNTTEQGLADTGIWELVKEDLKRMADVTFIILTKNEEINIKDCLDSIKGFAKRAVIVDSGSTDKTVEIAKQYDFADVYTHPFENYARQFNWGIDNTNITTKWTFRLDADERMTPELCRALEKLMIEHDSDDVNGVTMEAWLYFMGRKIKHGGSQKRKLMLFKTGIGRIEDRKMDEHTVLSHGTSVYCKERFIHYDFKDMTFWINKMNWYATREMQDYFEYMEGNESNIHKQDKVIQGLRQKKFGVYYKFPMFFRSWLLFIYCYIFQLGFLDGKEGFVYHWMYNRWYRALVDAKILEQKNYNRPFEKTGDLKEV